MSKVALTGGRGFLGWHTRAALYEQGIEANLIPVGDAFDPVQAKQAINGAKRLIHIAGINRAEDDEIREGNIRFAQQVANSINRADVPPGVVVYANSTQVGNGSAYGDAKHSAGEILREAAEKAGSHYVEVKLPNLFGEHGRPFYNAVTATFCHLLVEGSEPTVENDKELTLLHSQDAADLLIGNCDVEEQRQREQQESVSGLLKRLQQFDTIYRRGEIPDISDPFSRNRSIPTARTCSSPSQSFHWLSTLTTAAHLLKSFELTVVPGRPPSQLRFRECFVAGITTAARLSDS